MLDHYQVPLCFPLTIQYMQTLSPIYICFTDFKYFALSSMFSTWLHMQPQVKGAINPNRFSLKGHAYLFSHLPFSALGARVGLQPNPDKFDHFFYLKTSCEFWVGAIVQKYIRLYSLFILGMWSRVPSHQLHPQKGQIVETWNCSLILTKNEFI